MTRCKGITIKGERCKRTVKNGDRCHLHISLGSKDKISSRLEEKNKITVTTKEECPICLEKDGKKKVICGRCSKTIHEKCMSGMFRCECPLCRYDMSKIVSPNVLNRIKDNKEKMDEKERRRLLFRFSTDSSYLLPIEEDRSEQYFEQVCVQTILSNMERDGTRESNTLKIGVVSLLHVLGRLVFGFDVGIVGSTIVSIQDQMGFRIIMS